MFQFIVVVIAIALSAFLGLVGMFYAGNVFGSGSEKAIYVRYQNEAVQIREAMRLYQVDNSIRMDKFTDVSQQNRDPNFNFDALVNGKYLKDMSLKYAGWTIEKGIVRKPLEIDLGSMSQSTQLERCRNFNTFASKNINATDIKDGCPLCSDVRYTDYPACWIPE